MVILEAMASGLPVIVPNTGGAQDCIIHGETGYVVQDMTEFESRLDHLIHDEQLRMTMGIKARKQAESQSWEPTLDRLMAVFEGVHAGQS
jgi:glycosyltransferase involved in cell wall biosynthesis